MVLSLLLQACIHKEFCRKKLPFLLRRHSPHQAASDMAFGPPLFHSLIQAADSATEVRASLYNGFVARGWESKSVESQIESAREDPGASKQLRKNPDELVRDRERELLRLQRINIQQKFDSSENPRYREQLTHALADIDAKLAAMGPQS
jgi:hypothetical protein